MQGKNGNVNVILSQQENIAQHTLEITTHMHVVWNRVVHMVCLREWEGQHTDDII